MPQPVLLPTSSITKLEPEPTPMPALLQSTNTTSLPLVCLVSSALKAAGPVFQPGPTRTVTSTWAPALPVSWSEKPSRMPFRAGRTSCCQVSEGAAPL